MPDELFGSFLSLGTGLLIVLGYLLGSIPSAVWIGKAFYGTDVREHGSGNMGSTNTFRVLGKKAGITVQLLDIVKGVIAALLPWIAVKLGAGYAAESLPALKLATGLAAVIGHILPVFAGFRGGKGINTLLGVMLTVNPLAVLFCLIVFLVIVFSTKYVSLGSMLGTLVFPLYYLISPLINQTPFDWLMIGLGAGVFVLVLITHRENIGRLAKGVENKANIRLFKRKG